MDVLIAHGSGAVRRELAGALAERGDELLEVADGVAALELLLREGGPNLALIDWDLPRLEGPELCRLLRDFTLGRPTYLILLSSAPAQRDIAAGLEAGAHDFAVLPLADEDLRARVDFARQLVEMPWGRAASTEGSAAPRCAGALPGSDDRQTILRRLGEELARTQREGAPLSIALLQLDGLEDARRRGGSEASDAMLCETARRLRESLRPYDGLGRVAEGQFLVTMPKTSDEDVESVLERLRGVLAAESLTVGQSCYRLSATIGGATGCEETAPQLLAAARDALEAARAEGPDRVVAGPRVELQAVIVQL